MVDGKHIRTNSYPKHSLCSWGMLHLRVNHLCFNYYKIIFVTVIDIRSQGNLVHIFLTMYFDGLGCTHPTCCKVVLNAVREVASNKQLSKSKVSNLHQNHGIFVNKREVFTQMWAAYPSAFWVTTMFIFKLTT